MIVRQWRLLLASDQARDQGFKIPDMWRPSIMAVLHDFSEGDKAKQLSSELRNEITRDLVTQLYACTERIEKPFCTDVAIKASFLSILSCVTEEYVNM